MAGTGDNRSPEQNNGNTFSGIGGSVVQAGNITGGIHLHPSHRARLPIPRQLPAPAAHFVNRSDELAQLDLCLSPDHPVVISAIAGTAGSGKTALAVHWAHRARTHFPDGDLYVDLRGYHEGDALEAGQVLNRFLRALEIPPESIPADVDDQAALYRSVLNERRVLVVLDNAATPAQVRPLLPAAPGSLTLVTSRNRLPSLVVREGANSVTLDLLTEEESLALLREVLGDTRVDAEPEAARELTRRCCFLPLALRIVAERAVGAPSGSLADLAADLAAERDRLDALATDDETTISAVFSWSYRALPEECARVFRLLGLHPGDDISLPAVAALAGVRTTQARRHLDTLVNANLLEQPSRDRYRFHDLLRAYATERADQDEPESERNDALDRLFTWYLRTADTATRKALGDSGLFSVPIEDEGYELPTTRFDSSGEALAWMDSESLNVVPLIQRAAEIGRADFAWKLPAIYGSYFQMRRHSALWLEANSIALTMAQRSGNAPAEAEIQNGIGLIHFFHTQDYRKSVHHFECSLEIWDRIGNRYGHALTLGNLGDAHRLLGEHETALRRARQGRDLWREIGDRWGESASECTIGSILRELERPDEALTSHSRAHRLSIETGYRWSEGLYLEEIAKTQRVLGNLGEAIDALFQALDAYRAIDHRWGIATASDALGDALSSEGRTEEAWEAWSRALPIFGTDDPDRAAQVRARLGSLP